MSKQKHHKQSLKLSNTIRALKEEIENSLGELIREYGKESENDPNVYEIDFPEKDTFLLDGLWVGGKITLDVAYYNGIITIELFKESDCKEKESTIDFEGIEDVRLQNHIYRIMATNYE